MRPTFRRGHNAALLALRRRIGAMLAEPGLSDTQRQTLATVSAECRAMRQRAGCPFADGHKAVLAWMHRRRTLPPGPRRKFARELRALAYADKARAVHDAKAEYRRTRAPLALHTLATRLLSASLALERLDTDQLLQRQHATSAHRLAKTAVQCGLWT